MTSAPNLAESIAAILAMHEGRMLRARVALLELAEEIDEYNSSCGARGRAEVAEEPSAHIRAIARELATPTREPGACPNHPAAETIEVISCALCGAWKPSKDSPLVYIGADGVHRAVRNSPTPPPCPREWREDDELVRCDLEEGHAGAHRYRNVFNPPTTDPDLFAPVGKASFPDQKIADDAAAENKGGAPPPSTPISDQQKPR